jgi:DNA-binding NarL/FixJ family response regulator
MKTVSVVIVDDHEIVRAGLTTLLAREPDIRVIGTAATGQEGLRLIEELKPTIAVVDYSLPRMSGVELCEKIGQRFPKIPVIILTTFLEDTVVFQALEAGAKAFVYKDVEARDLKRAIRAVAKGQAMLDPKVAGRVMDWARKHRFSASDQPLSIRETEVLRLVATGSSNPEIADTLGLAPNTIKTYLQRAVSKLKCRNRSEAAAMASERGLL